MHDTDGYEMWVVVLFEYTTFYKFLFPFLGQILERDGMDIVPPEFQRYVDADSVNFIENICKF